MASTNIHTFDGSFGVGTNSTSYKFDVVGGDTKMGGNTTMTTLGVTDTTDSISTSLPTPLTDEQAQCYLDRYVDLRNAFGATNITAAKSHWITNGFYEGRDASCPGDDTTNGAMRIVGGLGVAKKVHTNRLYAGQKLGIGLAGAATETVDVNGTTSATRVDINGISYSHVPTGVILMWHGNIASPPSGWAICDGTNGTPNLRGYMIIGRNGTYTAGSTGGNSDLTMTTGTLPAHEHEGTSTAQDGQHTHASVTTAQAGQHSHAGDTAQHNQAHTHGGDTSQNGSHDHEGTTSNSGNHNHGVSNQSHGHNHFAAHAANVFDGIGGHNGSSQSFNISGWIFGSTIGLSAGQSGNHTHTLTITAIGHHTHELSVTDDPDHSHSIATTQNGGHEHAFTTPAGGDAHLHTATTQQTGSNQSYEKLPPYRAIAYIMKL
jgi:microcystin-dependent protein